MKIYDFLGGMGMTKKFTHIQ